jgi:hypothetical protein
VGPYPLGHAATPRRLRLGGIPEVEIRGFPVLTWEDAVAHGYQAPGTPFCYVMDGEGMIANMGFAGTEERPEALVESRTE